MERTADSIVARTFAAHGTWLEHQLRSKGADAATAEDIVQDAFALAMEHPGFDDDAHCLRWLQVVARNRLTDLHRSAARRYASGPLPRVLPDVDGDPLETVCRSDTGAEVRAALQRMTEREALLLWQRDALGLPVAHAAAATGVTTGSAHVLLTRARRRFSDRWSSMRSAFLLPFARTVRSARPSAITAPGLAFSFVLPAVVVGVLGLGALSPVLRTSPDPDTRTQAAVLDPSPQTIRDAADDRVEPDATTAGLDPTPRRAVLEAPNRAVVISDGEGIDAPTTARVRVTVDAAGIQDDSETSVHGPTDGPLPACVDLHVGDAPELDADACD